MNLFFSEPFTYATSSHMGRTMLRALRKEGFIVVDFGKLQTGLRARYLAASQFPVQVIRPDGLPDVALTVFGNDLSSMLSEGSVRGYVREVLLFANWAERDAIAAGHQWRMFGDPREVRNLVREYLTVAGECKVIQRPDTLGVRVAYVSLTQRTRVNVRLLLAALKKLYEVLRERGFYPHDNPLVHADATKAIAEFRRGERAAIAAVQGREPMPAASGVDEPSAGVRLSENYFRLVHREWQPQTIDDCAFPARVYEAGKKFGWRNRELCVVRTLFESGARISEVLDLTAADWSTSGFTNRFLAPNKGSHGRRVKTLIVSGPTAKLFRKYFDNERIARPPEMDSVSKLSKISRTGAALLSEVRIFTTTRGTSLTAGLFRDHYWKPALKAAGLDADPHLCRHWFVTNALRHIEQSVRSETELIRRKEELIQYMSWRSGERTLKAYEHVQRAQSFAESMRSIHHAMRRRENTAIDDRTSDMDAKQPSFDQDLAFLLGEDHDA